MKPLDAKLYFKFQLVINLLIILAIFLPLTLVLAKLPYRTVGIIGLIGLLFFLFFQVLDKRAVGIDCPKCKGRIESNTPWVCGFCQGKNNKTDEFPFLNQCQNCQAEPKAYKCHHCGELIFLSRDQLQANFATCLNLNTAATPTPPVVNGATQRKEEKEAALHKIEMIELSAKLKATKQRTSLGNRNPGKEIEESYMKFHASRMGRREFARQQRAINAVQFKDDPEMLQDSEEVMKEWLREGT